MEDEEQINVEEELKSETPTKNVSKSMQTPLTSNKRRNTRSRVSEITQLEDITEDTGEENSNLTNTELTVQSNNLPLSSPKKSTSEESQSKTLNEAEVEEIQNTPLVSNLSMAAQNVDINPVLQTSENQLEGTPQRVTRANSRSSGITSPSKLSEKSIRTRQPARKPPLTLLKDPFSPQITEEQKQKFLEKREKEKAKPRKKYSAIKKVKSRKI